MIGTRIGPYEILEEVGRGGMASVYRARQTNLNRDVAIKVIDRNIRIDTVLVARFEREAQLVARLEHPHILPVYDFDGRSDPPYIVMRYLPTGTLQNIMQNTRLPLPEIATIYRQVASALDYAHSVGVVHRDIKPSNIMLDREGNAFLTDFGVAHLLGSAASLTVTGAIVGTPPYMAPEQGMGQPVDGRADFYALGVILYELLTGSPPYSGENPLEVMIKHVNAPIPSILALRPDLPPSMQTLIEKALAKKPEDRYQTGKDLLNDFSTLAGETLSVTSTVLQDALSEAQNHAAAAPEPPPPPATQREKPIDELVPSKTLPVTLSMYTLAQGIWLEKRYELLERLDRGERCRVYHAFDHELEREVAIKIITSDSSHHAARFKQEAKILGSLHHAHIIPFFAYSTQDQVGYIVMPLLKGGTLREHLTSQRVAPPATLQFLRQLAGAVDYLHQKSIIHRDLKASNIMLNEQSDVFIVDFGIAKSQMSGAVVTLAEEIIGTPAYMSPEQCAGMPVVPATDQYALGVLAYQMLTGVLPFDAPNHIAVMRAHVFESATPPSHHQSSLPAACDEVVLKALAKKPEARYANTSSFVEALSQAYYGGETKAEKSPASSGHVFVSYSQKDDTYAHTLAADLRKRGFNVWIDDRIEYGDHWWETIVSAIKASTAFIVVMSPASKQSQWVQRELHLALKLEKPIFPLLLDDENWEIFVTMQYADVLGGELPRSDFYRRLNRAVSG